MPTGSGLDNLPDHLSSGTPARGSYSSDMHRTTSAYNQRQSNEAVNQAQFGGNPDGYMMAMGETMQPDMVTQTTVPNQAGIGAANTWMKDLMSGSRDLMDRISTEAGVGRMGGVNKRVLGTMDRYNQNIDAYTDALTWEQALLQQQYDSAVGESDVAQQLRDLEREGLGLDRKAAAKKLGITMQELDETMKGHKRDRYEGIRDNNGAYTGRGMFHSGARREGNKDLRSDFRAGKRGVAIGRDAAQFTHDNTQAGISLLAKGLNISDAQAKTAVNDLFTQLGLAQAAQEAFFSGEMQKLNPGLYQEVAQHINDGQLVPDEMTWDPATAAAMKRAGFDPSLNRSAPKEKYITKSLDSY